MVVRRGECDLEGDRQRSAGELVSTWRDRIIGSALLLACAVPQDLDSARRGTAGLGGIWSVAALIDSMHDIGDWFEPGFEADGAVKSQLACSGPDWGDRCADRPAARAKRCPTKATAEETAGGPAAVVTHKAVRIR